VAIVAVVAVWASATHVERSNPVVEGIEIAIPAADTEPPTTEDGPENSADMGQPGGNTPASAGCGAFIATPGAAESGLRAAGPEPGSPDGFGAGPVGGAAIPPTAELSCSDAGASLFPAKDQTFPNRLEGSGDPPGTGPGSGGNSSVISSAGPSGTTSPP